MSRKSFEDSLPFSNIIAVMEDTVQNKTKVSPNIRCTSKLFLV